MSQSLPAVVVWVGAATQSVKGLGEVEYKSDIVRIINPLLANHITGLIVLK